MSRRGGSGLQPDPADALGLSFVRGGSPGCWSGVRDTVCPVGSPTSNTVTDESEGGEANLTVEYSSRHNYSKN